MLNIKIPPELAKEPFYKTTIITVPDDVAQNDNWLYTPFIGEILWFNRCITIPPFEHSFIHIPKLQQVWEEEKSTLQAFYEARRRKDARPLMIKHIAAFMNALYWMNGSMVDSVGIQDIKKQVETFSYAPVNAGERLAFLLESPDHYHSFVQLNELFSEHKKQFAVMKVKQKHKHNPYKK
ncbi:hypothetical protein SAMN05192534_101492 [Alteribacillus persepolensis]|uniref:YpoC-like domain-containing protein n=1 Tax=Alteribacillus persepolensis TaxID=568899 RepID=A0A1G7ZE86_9BACI|nr:hypothetical protein [Alteribacillus persepolensis]SDH06410.1 hypothetical protein SAMN05192534_101492 [Alteribacillus persepolensis]